jgi:uncharacterized Zn finger protein
VSNGRARGGSGGMRGGRYPPPAKPRPVEGGLKARRGRGTIGQTWWSERFVQVLEDIGLGNRLARGRAYARRGQVISLDIDAGLVSALVQGSRSRPYRVRVGITALGKAQWAAVEAALGASAWYTARLLAGEMPEDIEDVFSQAGYSLFPASSQELSMDCSCPDYEVPCKHIAAAFYLLAEAFDADPFAILAWRGRQRDDLLANLASAEPGSRRVAADQAEPPGPPLADLLATFYEPQGPIPATPAPATPSYAILAQLPEVAVAVREQPLAELLRPAYLAFGGGGDAKTQE